MGGCMKKRIISAIIALAIAVPLIVLGGIYFEVGILLIAALAFKELIDLKESHNKFPFIMMLLGVFSVFILILANNLTLDFSWGITYPLLAFVVSFLLIPIIFFKNAPFFLVKILYFKNIRIIILNNR